MPFVERQSLVKILVCAAFVSSNGSNEIEYVPLNENPFSTNELIKFKESNISANIAGVVPGDRDIKDNFELDPEAS